MWPSFARFRSMRDLFLVEQRGFDRALLGRRSRHAGFPPIRQVLCCRNERFDRAPPRFWSCNGGCGPRRLRSAEKNGHNDRMPPETAEQLPNLDRGKTLTVA